MCEVCLLWRSFSGNSTHISLDESRLSLSRVRRGYCSRTSPIDRERLASRVDAGLLRYTYRCMFRSHFDRSNRISGIRKICTTSLATPTCQVSRECVELHGVANFSCSSRLPTRPHSRIFSFFFLLVFFSFNFVLEFLLSDPIPSTAFASVCELWCEII